MNDTEELAALYAIKQKVDERYQELRSKLTAECEESGTERKALKIGGMKVGNFIIPQSKDEIAITDEKALESFALDNGFASERYEIAADYMDAVVKILKDQMEPDEFDKAVKKRVEMPVNWKGYLDIATIIEDDEVRKVAICKDTGEPVEGVTVINGKHQTGRPSKFDADAAVKAIRTLPTAQREYLLIGGE